MEKLLELKESFISYYGNNEKNIMTFFAPGRVNLIGEHIDYNGGYVLPAALSLGIWGLMRERDDDIIRMKSLNMGEEVSISLKDNIEYISKDGWANYPKGVIRCLMGEGHSLKGCDLLFFGDLPDSAGLSSSAAIEVLTAYMMLYKSLGENMDRLYITHLCQSVENSFIGVNCGIMDQFAVSMGRENSAVILDCHTLSYKYIPFKLEGYSLVIMNTNKKRELIESKYNERCEECEEGLRLLKHARDIKNLCEAELEEVYRNIREEILLKRARHVVTENQRVMRAVNALESENIEAFGRLLTESHMSLKNDYEVTGLELDALVFEAIKVTGCLGARMTGAGFGGCAIALVKNEEIEDFRNRVSEGYRLRTGLTPEFYVSVIGDGVKLVG